MKLKFSVPDWFYVEAFWKAASFALAGVLGLLVFFKVLPVEYAVGGAAILSWVLSVLNMFGVHPQVMARRSVLAKNVKPANKKSK